MAKSKGEAQITRYAGLAGIRKKSTVYIGPNNSDGLWTILREPADNFVDRALKGKNKSGHIVFGERENSYWVIDDDTEGFPVSVQTFEDERGRKEKLSQFYAATGLTHAGSNFDSEAISRGTHGIGIKATNAMSGVFRVWTYNRGQWYGIEYRDAKLVKDVFKTTAPKLPYGLKARRGSVVYFEPDLKLFTKGARMLKAPVNEWAELTSHLVGGLEIKITFERGKTRTYKSKGLAHAIAEWMEREAVQQTGKTFICQEGMVDVALAFTNVEKDSVKAYTNGLHNIDGGEHVRAVMDALMASLKPYRKKTDTFKLADIRDGLLGIVNAKLAAPAFSNQRKDGLLDDRVYAPVKATVLAALAEFWSKNKKMARDVIQRANELRSHTNSFLQDKKLLKKVKDAGKKMSTKLADIAGKKVPLERRELFLVEGDSAAGTAKKARNRDYQATFSLRGKPLNVLQAKQEKINANAEVTGILAALGVGSNSKNAEEIRYGKVILLADPDVDGRHINCLLLALLWKFTPHLFREGKIYMMEAPEYYVYDKRKLYFGTTPEEVRERAGGYTGKVRHIKGWGELDADKMKPMAFVDDTRTLIRINPPKGKDGVQRFLSLMGNKSEYRQELLGVSE